MFAQVPWMQPSFCIERLLCLFRHVEVTHEDVPTPEADLTVSFLVRVVQLCLAPWKLYATAAEHNAFLIHRVLGDGGSDAQVQMKQRT